MVSAKQPRFPIAVKRGSAVVKIYREEKKGGGTYYRVSYHLGGKRQRPSFNDLEAAVREAEAKASQLSRGDIDAVQLTGRDRLIYGRALDAVRSFDVPLDSVALEYADARKLLNGASVVDAARFYARHHGKGVVRKPLANAVDEMIAVKETAGLSEAYIPDLRYRLGALKDAFHCDVNALTPDDLAAFFTTLNLSPRSFNNFLGAFGTFFAFAKRRGWLSSEADLLRLVERRKGKSAPVEIYTPAEAASLLKHSSSDLAPCLALGLFAGLRSEEILRLDWADVERRPGFVEVAAAKAKTAARRLVPIADNLALWLACASVPVTGLRQGRLWPHSKAWFFESMRIAAKAAGAKLKQNAARHSFITYRLATIQDVNRVALEAGTSPKMIFQHYRELATPEQASTWNATVPGTATNILPMQKSNQ